MKKAEKNGAQSTPFNWRRQLPNILFIVIVLLLTFGYLFSSILSAGDDLEGETLPRVQHWGYFIPAILLLILSISCEAFSLKLLLHKSGYRRSLYECGVYASADQYFSAITPSASGGQPASAYYMTKSGVPLYVSSAALVLNVTIYTLSLVLLAVLAFILRPGFYTQFDGLSRLLVICGIGFHGIFILICIAFMCSRRLVDLVGVLIIRLLSKLRIFKDRDAKIEAFRRATGNYRACFEIVRKRPFTILLVLFLNLTQRFLLALIPFFIFRAYGITDPGFMDVTVMQLYCLVGSSGLPVPGAMGVSELLTETLYGFFIPAPVLCTTVMLVTRAVSAYLAILGCGTLTIVYHIRHVGRLYEGEEEPDLPDVPVPSVDDAVDEAVAVGVEKSE